MKKILLFLFVFVSIQSSTKAQYNKVEFHLEPFGNIFYAQNGGTKLINDIGLNYQHYVFPKTYIIVGTQGNFKNYTDECEDCPNNYSGKLANTSILASLGVRYLFLEEVVETWNIFTEASFYYAATNANGTYKHNTTEGELYTYNKYRGTGLSFKLGTIYQFNSPWYVGANLGLYFGGGKLRSYNTVAAVSDELLEELQEINNARQTRIGIELRAGINF